MSDIEGVMGLEANRDRSEKDSYFKNGFEHIYMELDRLGFYIRRYIYLFRKSLCPNDASIARSPGYISNEEVDYLLECKYDLDYQDKNLQALNEELQLYDHRIDALAERSLQKNVALPLIQLSQQFHLSWLEYQTLIVCLASELRNRYDKFYAYLQDDIARKKPSVDFVLNLFVLEEFDRWQARSVFSHESALFRHDLLEMNDDLQSPSGASGLAKLLKLNPRILNYILGQNSIDARLDGLLRIVEPTDSFYKHSHNNSSIDELVDRYLGSRSIGSKNLLVHIAGPLGVGKKALLCQLCQKLSCPLLVLDAEKLHGKNGSAENILRLAFREALLFQGVLYIENIDYLFEEAIESNTLLRLIDFFIREYGWLTFVGGSKLQQQPHRFECALYHYHEISIPDEKVRAEIWSETLQESQLSECSETLAQRFSLSPAMIRNVSESAYLQNGQPSFESLASLCRSQSGQNLSRYAKKIKPGYGWDDLILPVETKQVLKHICGQVRNESKVFNQWGFSSKLQYGRGLSVLYSGPPGTGKTMSAQVMANDLSIDLYKIDLSGVVSKYIGETEKNLNRIFEEAEHCNAILFFDEADALFGKRTEVSDAHDRYANIEVSYLLQKMEEYSGIVILATNLRNNMDNAFTRRIRFIIEFPFPDVESRLQIWKKTMPVEAPVHSDVDFEYLANRVKVSGANIKNIALNAAFYAAQQKCDIDMHCLSYSIEQEYRKIGKLWVADKLNGSKEDNKTVSV